MSRLGSAPETPAFAHAQRERKKVEALLRSSQLG